MLVGLTIGYGSSFWAWRWARRQMERYYPDRVLRGAAEKAGSLKGELRGALAEARSAMKAREAELRADVERRSRRLGRP